MFSRRFKVGYFVLEGLNSFATVYYFYYFYFFMQTTFGFGNKANLVLAALNGASYALFSWGGGKFAQRFGYYNALKLGFGIMMSAMVAGLQLHSASAHVAVMVVTVFGMSFTWPTLEALISEGEPRAGLQDMVGIYNIVWAGSASIANFTGGAMLEKLGAASLFYVPLAIQIIQLGLTLWLEWKAGPAPVLAKESTPLPPTFATPGGARTARILTDRPATASRFLRMAWLANPCGYVAINTLIAAMPGVAHRLQLSTMLAGFCCSVWCFARVAAFITLWRWDAWHYRFRWLFLAYALLVASFASILLAPNLVVLVAAQLVFGAAVGLLYYSSLFYSMDSSETKGEHGGIHEAAIGLGNFTGPAVGAAALQFLPAYPNGSAVAVSLLLLVGLGGLAALWRLPRA